jgi:peroxiredoxin
MKNTLILFVAIILLASCGNNKKSEENKSEFELKGKLANPGGEQIYLDKLNVEGISVLDTAILNENGEFIFLHANPSLGFYRLRITDSNFGMMVLDSNQKVTVTGDTRDLGHTFKVEGSPDSQLFQEVNEIAQHSYQKRDSLMRSYEAYANLNKGNEAKIKEYAASAEQQYNTAAKALNDYLLNIINKHSASLVAIIALQQLAPEFSEDGYMAYYKQVDDRLTLAHPGAVPVLAFHQSVQNMFKTGMGSVAPDFTLPTPEGKTLALSSLKGKYVLLDFWASWCGPCRAESPNMVKMYQKFHPKGLEILSISLDDNKDKWISAIKKDNLKWNHVSDLGGWQSAAAKMYTVTSIPQTFLLDKEGKIIAKGLRAEGLEAKLDEILK